MIWIAVDALGGDDAPRNIVDGALAAVRHFDLGVLLVGRAHAVEAELRRHDGQRGERRIELRLPLHETLDQAVLERMEADDDEAAAYGE